MGGIKYHVGVVAARTLSETNEARQIEQRRGAMQTEITEAKNAEINSINRRLADALERLRNRPDRLPIDPVACKGATGAELSGPDAGFLEREAARADSLRAALSACYKQYDSLTAK
ncbi:MAG: hypothetical protein EOO23_04445 [Comamonadaceae bacterium]|nr:MAG: hypothetical protein EOO23_04445 [Comamonadaceae bacterium]